jgi:hypothetical protein
MNGTANGQNDVDDIEFRRLGLASHMIRMEDEKITREKNSQRYNPEKRFSRKSMKKVGGSCLEGSIQVPRNKSLEEVSSGYRRVEVPKVETC